MPIFGAIIGAAVSAAVGSALAPKPPGAPDLVAGNREGVLADAETLPARRKIEAASKLGTATDYETGRMVNATGTEQVVQVHKGQNRYEWVPWVPEEWEEGGKYHSQIALIGQPFVQTRSKTGLVPETKNADFTGIGEADVQIAQADTLAREMLALQRDLGPKFIEQRNKELAIADPEGVAARSKLAELIQADAARADTAKRPLADEMERQLLTEAMAGDQFTSEQDARLERALLESAMSRGDTANVGGTRASLLDMGRQGRIDDRMRAGLSWLTSGATPEDVSYRRNQQVMGNLGSFVNGQTPLAQFGQLSGAQNGAAPFRPSTPQTGLNAGAGSSGQQFGVQNYGNQLQQVLNTPNPWLTALTAGVKGYTAYNNSR